MLTIDHREDLALLTLSHGAASALDLELCAGIHDALDSIRQSSARALVMTGTGSVFSAGVDLNRMIQGKADYIAEFLPAFGRVLDTLLFFPKPVVAAINGHAIAGGGLMACAADTRLMASGPGRIGVPELRVGVAFPPLAMEIMRSRLVPSATTDVILSGKLCTPEAASQSGMVHHVVAPDELLPTAMAKAKTLAGVQPALYAQAKEQLNQPIRDAIDAGNQRWGEQVQRGWESDDTTKAIKAYVQETFKRR